MKTALLLIGGLAASAGACRSADSGSTSDVKDLHGPVHDAPSTHGMLIVGDGPVYLSHLPMFHKPHDYQVLIEVELVKTGIDATALYVQDRKTTGEKIYTAVPETFSLPDLFTPADSPVRQSFKATLVRGHFERGGSPILEDVTVKVKKVVFAKKFEKNPDALPELRYFLFGNENELFAAHIVNKKPDFDHVLSVRVTTGVQSDAQSAAIRAGSLLKVKGAANDVEHAFKEGVDVHGKIGGADVTIQVITDYYLETGDLSF